MIPLNFQPVSGDNLNMASIDGLLQSAHGTSNAAPVETSFSSYMERTAEADSTDGSNQTQQISSQQTEYGAEIEEGSIEYSGAVTAADEKLIAFENQLAVMSEFSAQQDSPVLEPFSLEISFDEDGELYSGVQIEFTTQSETDFDAALDRFLGLTEDSDDEAVLAEGTDLVAAENTAAAVLLPTQPVFQQDIAVHVEMSEAADEPEHSVEASKKSVKTAKNTRVMDSIAIVDERTADTADKAEAGKTVTMTSFDGNHTAEMSLNLAQNAEQQYFQDNQTGAYTGNIEAGITRTDFASMISDEISNNADEFVKAGSIVLKNDNKGSINLILHPEELGNVKIRLELSDNQITGKIVVASKEAYDAFKQSMNDLKQAFVASGFDTNGFDLTWTGSQGSNQHGNPENQDRVFENLNAAIARHSSDSYLDNMPDDIPESSARGTTYINLVA